MNTLNTLIHALQIFAVDGFWAILAGLGFAMVFNIPRNMLWAAVLAGGLGHGVRFVLFDFGMNLPAASLIGSIVIGLWAVWCSRHFQRPALIFSIAGVIPMIPGKFAYLTMIGLIKLAIVDSVGPNDLQQVMHNMVMTALILGALASGIAAPQLLLMRRLTAKP